jgi:hypothetical protein
MTALESRIIESIKSSNSKQIANDEPIGSTQSIFMKAKQ